MSTLLPYSQAGRFARIDFDGEEMLLLVSLEGSEALSELFSFRIEAIAPIDGDFDPDWVLGARATVTLGIGSNGAPGQQRKIVGMIRSIRELHEDERFVWYELRFVPPAWVSSQNQSFRIFQSKTLPQIFDALLGSNAVTTLSSETLTRNYCVQYGESDLGCATRLIEESGYYFYFPQDSDFGVMTIRDDSAKAPYRGKENIDSIAFSPVRGAVMGEPRVSKFAATRSLSIGNVELINRSYQTSKGVFKLSKEVADQRAPSGKSLPLLKRTTIRDYPAGHVKYFDIVKPTGGDGDTSGFESAVGATMEEFASARAAELSLKCVQFDGASNSTRIVPGYPFELTGHRKANGEFLVTRVEHSLRLNPFGASTEVTETYENRFVAIPRSLPFSTPRRTPRPHIHGHQTAIVVGVDESTQPPGDGDPIFTDGLGRVRVQFPWCENDFNSCWIRVAHAWAGQRWGSQFIPRIGNEVVVGFENGDPDCPLVYGSVYNADNPFAHELDKFKRLSGVMNRTFDRDEKKELDYTGFSIDDTPGKQVFHLRSAKTLIQDVGKNMVTVAPKALDAYVGESSVKLVGGFRGFSLPLIGDVSFDLQTIEATGHTGVWKPMEIKRLAFGPFVTDANFGSQLDFRFGFQSKLYGHVHYDYGSFLLNGSKLASLLSASAASALNMFFLADGLTVGKVEKVSGHHWSETSYYNLSGAAQHLFISGELPTATWSTTVADKLCTALGITMKLMAGITPLEVDSPERKAVAILNTVLGHAGSAAATLRLADASLQKVTTCQRIAALTPELLFAALLHSEKALEVDQATAIANSLPQAVADAVRWQGSFTEYPLSDDGNKSDNYSYTRRNHLVEAGELFSVVSKSALVEVDNLLANCHCGFVATAGDAQELQVVADNESLTVCACNGAATYLTLPKSLLKIRRDSIELSSGLNDLSGKLTISPTGVELSFGTDKKIVINGAGIAITAPVIAHNGVRVSTNAPAEEHAP